MKRKKNRTSLESVKELLDKNRTALRIIVRLSFVKGLLSQELGFYQPELLPCEFSAKLCVCDKNISEACIIC